MEVNLSSIHNEDEDDISNPLIKIDPDNLIESNIVSDLPKTEAGEEMIMVDPSLVTGSGDENKSQTVPINLIMQDGSVLQLNAVTEGDFDLVTLQNLVSAQLLQQQSDTQMKMELISLTPMNTDISTTTLPVESSANCIQSVTEATPQQQTQVQVIATIHNTQPEGNAQSAQLHSDTLLQPLITKQKGGWPKGKKRKPEKLVNAPKPPVTAYGRYTQVRRVKLREENPNLTFAEMVKIMGNEWSYLAKSEKKVYVDEAAADKKRYMRELTEYQQSAEYQDFVAKHRAKGKNESSLDTIYNLGKNLKDDVLHCEVCDIYFTNQHNRKEHFMGSRHMNNVSKLYEADLQKRRTALGLDGQGVEAVSVEVTEIPEQPSRTSLPDPLDLNSFMSQFIHTNHEREQELTHLRDRSIELRMEQEQLRLKYQELKRTEEVLTAELASSKTVGAALAAQIDGLSLVPNLFQQLKL